MLRFRADLFIKTINSLNLIESLMAQPASFLKIDNMVQFYAAQVKELYDHLEEVNLPVSAKKALSLYVILTNTRTDDHDARGQLIKQHSAELRDRIADELEGKAFFYVSDHVGLLSDPMPFGEAVDRSFPTAQYDISEASHCLALRRSTACVSHLMRALEVSLASLADALDLRLTTDNWNTILNDIETEIRSRTKVTHGQTWKERDEPFFAEAATHFRFIKNGWRNHAMHLKDKYTDEEAEAIYGSVRSFMRHLSERLSEAKLSC